MKIMEKYSVAFAEVSEILKIFPAEELNKIPKLFINVIEKYKDDNYDYELEDGVELHNQKMTMETKAILSVIYMDYICSEEEKTEILKEELKAELLEDEQKRIKYDPNKIFKANKVDKESKIAETFFKDDLIKSENKLIKLKWYEKILIKIKKCFYR